MRVCLVIKTNRGGRWLLPQAHALVEHDHQVRAYVADEPGGLLESLTALGVDARRSSALGDAGLGRAGLAVMPLVREIAAYRPQVINYHLYRSTFAGRIASLVARKAGTVHSVAGPLFLESRAVRLVERHLARLDDLIICSSQAVYELYRRLGISDSRLVVLPYGVDLEALIPPTDEERRAARRDLMIDDDDFVAICASYFYAPKRLVHRGKGIKGHDVLLRAWARYRSEGGRGRLLVVGGGFDAAGATYRAAVLSKYGVANDPSVSISGSVDDVRPFYRAADISVSPSRSENLGAPAEAGAMGVPSLASTAGGLPEVVLDGVTGWTCPVGDEAALAALLHVAADAKQGDVLRSMGIRARRLAEAKLDVRSLSRSYVTLLEDSARSHAGRRS